MNISTAKPRTAANRLGLDYERASKEFSPLPYSIIDVHTHLSGQRSTEIYGQVAEQFGIGLTYSMTSPQAADDVRRILGDRVRFIVVPDFQPTDVRWAVTEGMAERIQTMRSYGARLTKFWAGPRGLDIGSPAGFEEAFRIDAPHNIDNMRLTESLGMAAMVHVGDPDIWFATKYKNAARYGSKVEHYERFETVLDQFSMPFIAAHCGGWPEDLDFLDGLLSRHSHLFLDTSATKWMVRELSRHTTERVHTFFTRWQGRLLFGSDIVAQEGDVASSSNHEVDSIASRAPTYDLYASRYWALRTLFETRYRAESPIADPDLALIAPKRYSEFDAPLLHGHQLPPSVLKSLYHDAAHSLLESIYAS